MSIIHKALQKAQLNPPKQKSHSTHWIDVVLILIITLLSVATIFFYYPRILQQPSQGAPVAITTNMIKTPIIPKTSSAVPAYGYAKSQPQRQVPPARVLV